jgi:aminoglycoside phosphotransferase (APT) family kinase protein
MPTMPTIPTTDDDLTPEWLTAALAPRYPGVAVAAVEVVDRHELTNAHARIRVTYDEPAGAPAAMFCKVAPLDPSRRDAIIASGMGVREVRFYADLAPALTMRVPAAHVALTAADDRFVLLLEDLSESGCAVSDGTWGIAPDAAAGALADLAEMHARYEDPAVRAAEVPWATVSKPSTSYGAPMLRYGIEHHRDRLTDSFVAIAELYLTHHEELQAIWHEGPHTLIHGDPHIGNLFLDGDRVGFLDWGIINVNTPMRDVGYFLTMAMNPDDRRAHERDLLRHYLDVRAAHGASPLSFDDAWFAHRVQAAYNVPASCQVVTFPENASPGRRVFADAFLARAQASLDDLESLDAVRQLMTTRSVAARPNVSGA